MERLFHIAVAADWEQAKRDGAYRVSTLDRSLDEVGYVHLSFAHQVKSVADAFYDGRSDLVLLEIDPAKLGCDVVWTSTDRGSGSRTPTGS